MEKIDHKQLSKATSLDFSEKVNCLVEWIQELSSFLSTILGQSQFLSNIQFYVSRVSSVGEFILQRVYKKIKLKDKFLN